MLRYLLTVIYNAGTSQGQPQVIAAPPKRPRREEGWCVGLLYQCARTLIKLLLVPPFLPHPFWRVKIEKFGVVGVGDPYIMVQTKVIFRWLHGWGHSDDNKWCMCTVLLGNRVVQV